MLFAPIIACILFGTFVWSVMTEKTDEEYKRDQQLASDDNWSCGWYDD